MKSADPLVAFDQAIGEVIRRYVPTTVFRSRSGDTQWFDASYLRAYDAKQTAYRARCRASNADHWGQFVLARAELYSHHKMVLQGSGIMNVPRIL